jgi:hypothetical protein
MCHDCKSLTCCGKNTCVENAGKLSVAQILARAFPSTKDLVRPTQQTVRQTVRQGRDLVSAS